MSESTGQRIPLDADDTRGQHFRHLLSHPATLILGGILILAAGIGLAAGAGPAVGAAAAVGALLLILLIVFLLANSRAEADFFRSYAQGHSLQLQDGRSQVPAVTPLLRRGDNRYTTKQLRGTLPGGENGTLAHYTYEEKTRDSDGNQQTSYFKFTLVMCEVPEMAPFLEELYFQRRVGFRFLDGAEEIFCGQKDDINRARQVLEPSFLVWLADHSPEAFAFECVAGALVCNVKGHKKSASELDDF